MGNPCTYPTSMLSLAPCCTAVSEIIVVWSGGPPPDSQKDLRSAVPLRVREESVDSINTRFKPDPTIKTQAVFQVDDDVLLW